MLQIVKYRRVIKEALIQLGIDKRIPPLVVIRVELLEILGLRNHIAVVLTTLLIILLLIEVLLIKPKIFLLNLFIQI